MSNESGSSSKRTHDEIEIHDTCSLQDVIDDEKERNDIANAVLGASDPTNCSYKNGYVYRQALYFCLTCLNETKEKLTADELKSNDFLHGICLACSYECHANHELLELYTKRDFSCDCGNGKFSKSKTSQCKLDTSKKLLNESNKYNHNFNGVYCTCKRPYPETNSSNGEEEESNNDECMLQCTVCEDWFHLNHLTGNEKFPSNEEDFEEMICQTCMHSNSFLWQYQGYIALKSIEKDANKLNVNEPDTSVDALNVSSEAKSDQSMATSECFLANQRLKNKDLNLENKAEQACCFLNGWREALCKCNECMSMYKKRNIEYLLRINDTIKYYEAQGKDTQQTEQDENKLIDNQLSKLNRVSRVEFLHGVNDFKTELSDFLRSFANKGEVVKRENVTEFFESLEKRKRLKLDADKSGNVANFYCQ